MARQPRWEDAALPTPDPFAGPSLQSAFTHQPKHPPATGANALETQGFVQACTARAATKRRVGIAHVRDKQGVLLPSCSGHALSPCVIATSRHAQPTTHQRDREVALILGNEAESPGARLFPESMHQARIFPSRSTSCRKRAISASNAVVVISRTGSAGFAM